MIHRFSKDFGAFVRESVSLMTMLAPLSDEHGNPTDLTISGKLDRDGGWYQDRGVPRLLGAGGQLHMEINR